MSKSRVPEKTLEEKLQEDREKALRGCAEELKAARERVARLKLVEKNLKAQVIEGRLAIKYGAGLVETVKGVLETPKIRSYPLLARMDRAKPSGDQ